MKVWGFIVVSIAILCFGLLALGGKPEKAAAYPSVYLQGFTPTPTPTSTPTPTPTNTPLPFVQPKFLTF